MFLFDNDASVDKNKKARRNYYRLIARRHPTGLRVFTFRVKSLYRNQRTQRQREQRGNYAHTLTKK